MHRDLKPENILLDEDFNVKLCDFGWAQDFKKNQMRNSLCGTCEYMAPEVVFQKNHNEKIDIWCLGVLLYEMLHGLPPYNADSLQRLKSMFE